MNINVTPLTAGAPMPASGAAAAPQRAEHGDHVFRTLLDALSSVPEQSALSSALVPGGADDDAPVALAMRGWNDGATLVGATPVGLADAPDLASPGSSARNKPAGPPKTDAGPTNSKDVADPTGLGNILGLPTLPLPLPLPVPLPVMPDAGATSGSAEGGLAEHLAPAGESSAAPVATSRAIPAGTPTGPSAPGSVKGDTLPAGQASIDLATTFAGSSDAVTIPAKPDLPETAVQAKAITRALATNQAPSQAAATDAANAGGRTAEGQSAIGDQVRAALTEGGRIARSNVAAAPGIAAAVDSANGPIGGAADATPPTERLGDRTSPAEIGVAAPNAANAPSGKDATGFGGAQPDARQHDGPPSAFPTMRIAGVDIASSHAAPTAAAGGALSVVDPAVESDLPRQIVQAMRLQWKDGVGDARITLQPDHLGELSIAIRVEHGSVTATLDASAPVVRQWIQAHEPVLRQALADQGLHLDRLIVSDEPSQPSSSSNEPRRESGGEPQPRRQTRRPPTGGEATFEIIV